MIIQYSKRFDRWNYLSSLKLPLLIFELGEINLVKETGIEIIRYNDFINLTLKKIKLKRKKSYEPRYSYSYSKNGVIFSLIVSKEIEPTIVSRQVVEIPL